MTESNWQVSDPAGAPHCIRPETHWLRETTDEGREDGALWFSLQLSRTRAEQLYQLSGPFEELARKGARIAPASRTALKHALNVRKLDTIGADILVPQAAFAALQALPKDGIEITDAGLAVEGEIGDQQPLAADDGAKSAPGPIPNGSTVIIAIIDDGIGIANRRFRGRDGSITRVKHFLDQALLGTPAHDSGMVNELLARSCKASDIDRLLGLDEEQIYRKLGLIDLTPRSRQDPVPRLRQPLRAAVTHGTHMLDIAAGYDWRTQEAEAAKRPIIAVQLPTQVADHRSDTWLPQALKLALDWILVKADELSAELDPSTKRRLPLIVNASLASMAGPEDGQSDVERRINQFVKAYRGDDGPDELCTVVLAAGNSLQLRSAARLDMAGGSTEEISWRVQPDDKTPSFAQVWLLGDQKPHGQEAEVFLVPPRDAPALKVPSQLGKLVEWKVDGLTGARLYHQRLSRDHGGSRECITIAILPTADDREGKPVVPSGCWQIKIKSNATRPLTVDLRLHRDDVGLFSRSGARQSYFDHPGYQMFDPVKGCIINDELRDDPRVTPITRQGTLSTYAYAEGTVVVAGYRRSDGKPATYSSSSGHGTKRANNPSRGAVDEPDLAAVSEESPSLSGVLAGGTYSGSVAILNGTSVAAPQATRALAEEIAKRGSVNTLKGRVRRTDRGKRLGEGYLAFTGVPGYRLRSDR
jgi:hypothetical protein